MPRIKFSHTYDKMPTGDLRATLLEVFTADVKELSELFIEYDTRYLEWKWAGNLRVPEVKNYSLPRGKVLVLVLLSENQKRLWTTVRRRTPEKEAYYRRMCGEAFDIVIEEATA